MGHYYLAPLQGIPEIRDRHLLSLSHSISVPMQNCQSVVSFPLGEISRVSETPQKNFWANFMYINKNLLYFLCTMIFFLQKNGEFHRNIFLLFLILENNCQFLSCEDKHANNATPLRKLKVVDNVDA